MVQKIRVITMISAAALMMGACSSSSPLPGAKAPPPFATQAAPAPQAQAEEPQQQGGPAIAQVESRGLDRLDDMASAAGFSKDSVNATVFGNSSVEVFGLDGSDMSAPYGGERYAAARGNDGGMPASTDSSVMVYPVDGGQYPGASGASWPNSVLPVHNNSLTPYSRGGRGGGGGVDSPRIASGYAPSQIYFEHGSSRLGSGDRQALRQVAEQAKFAPVDRVSVEGHASTRTGVADPVEAKIVNLKQSMNRAFNVSSQLMRDGVPAEKIKTTVWGDTRNEGVGEAQSRRVDIITGAQ